jgi:hypothetical protein
MLGSMLIRSTTCSAFSCVFSSNLNRPQSYEMSGRFLKTLRKSGGFQAEYGGFNSLHPLQRFRARTPLPPITPP